MSCGGSPWISSKEWTDPRLNDYLGAVPGDNSVYDCVLGGCVMSNEIVVMTMVMTMVMPI